MTIREGALAVLAAGLGLGRFWPVARWLLIPGRSTGDEVRSLMGSPAAVHDAADGARILEYPGGPAGHQTMMIDISPDGRFVAMRRALTEAEFRRAASMRSREELRRTLGRPTETAWFEASQELVWSWKYLSADGRSEHFNAHFGHDGVLRRTSRTPDPASINSQ